jgi:putative endonuclease
MLRRVHREPLRCAQSDSKGSESAQHDRVGEWLGTASRSRDEDLSRLHLAGKSRSLYTGVTNDLERRVPEHKRKRVPGFTSKYNSNRLVHFEQCSDVRAAIQREKQIEGWLRAKKVALIVANNPAWRDLTEGWYSHEKHRGAPQRSP